MTAANSWRLGLRHAQGQSATKAASRTPELTQELRHAEHSRQGTLASLRRVAEEPGAFAVTLRRLGSTAKSPRPEPGAVVSLKETDSGSN
jgi:hypothetical protein